MLKGGIFQAAKKCNLSFKGLLLYPSTCLCFLFKDSEAHKCSDEEAFVFVGVDAIVDKWFSFPILDSMASLPKSGVYFSRPAVLWSLPTAARHTGDLYDVMRNTAGGGVGSFRFMKQKLKPCLSSAQELKGGFLFIFTKNIFQEQKLQ